MSATWTKVWTIWRNFFIPCSLCFQTVVWGGLCSMGTSEVDIWYNFLGSLPKWLVKTHGPKDSSKSLIFKREFFSPDTGFLPQHRSLRNVMDFWLLRFHLVHPWASDHTNNFPLELFSNLPSLCLRVFPSHPHHHSVSAVLRFSGLVEKTILDL